MENLEEFELVAKGMRKCEKSNEKKRLSFADATVAVIAGQTFQRMGTFANQKTSKSETNESEKPCVFLKAEIIEELQERTKLGSDQQMSKIPEQMKTMTETIAAIEAKTIKMIDGVLKKMNNEFGKTRRKDNSIQARLIKIEFEDLGKICRFQSHTLSLNACFILLSPHLPVQ